MVGLTDYSKTINGESDTRSATLWGGRRMEDAILGRYTIPIESTGGTEFIKIGEFPKQNSRFRIFLIGGIDNGILSPRQVEIVGWKRNDEIGGYHWKFGDDASQEANLIVTAYAGDSDGNNHQDGHLYLKADDFAAQSRVVVDVQDPETFVRDKVTGLSSSDVSGDFRINTANSPTMPVGSGDFTTHGKHTINDDLLDSSGNVVYNQTEGHVPSARVESGGGAYASGDWVLISSMSHVRSNKGSDSYTTSSGTYVNLYDSWNKTTLDWSVIPIPSNCSGPYFSYGTVINTSGATAYLQPKNITTGNSFTGAEMTESNSEYSYIETPRVEPNNLSGQQEYCLEWRNNDGATTLEAYNQHQFYVWAKMN